jgi:hypothetical protein
MVDISLCSSAAVCPVAKTCKRNPDHYVGKIGKWQSWFGRAAEEITENGCCDFTPLPKLADDIPERKRRKVIESLADSELWGH